LNLLLVTLSTWSRRRRFKRSSISLGFLCSESLVFLYLLSQDLVAQRLWTTRMLISLSLSHIHKHTCLLLGGGAAPKEVLALMYVLKPSQDSGDGTDCRTKLWNCWFTPESRLQFSFILDNNTRVVHTWQVITDRCRLKCLPWEPIDTLSILQWHCNVHKILSLIFLSRELKVLPIPVSHRHDDEVSFLYIDNSFRWA
jgi:hypothetical protein